MRESLREAAAVQARLTTMERAVRRTLVGMAIRERTTLQLTEVILAALDASGASSGEQHVALEIALKIVGNRWGAPRAAEESTSERPAA